MEKLPHLGMALALLCASCAGWQQTADTAATYAHTAGVMARETAFQLMDIKCARAARQCIAEGVTDANNCQPWVGCNEDRHILAVALISLQYAVMTARVAISAGNEQDAIAAVAKAAEAAEKVRKLLAEWGLLR